MRGSWPLETWLFESAEFRLPVHGARGEGNLHAKLVKSDDDWVFAELSLRMAGSAKQVNLLDLAEQPARAPISTERRLYLVPLGDLKQDEIGLAELPGFLLDKFNLEVKILAPMEIESRARDRNRRQVVAEELQDQMLRRLPALAKDPNAVLIGITDEPMYFRQRGWSGAPTYWAGIKLGLVSTVRFVEDSDHPASDMRVKARLRKAVTRVAGMTVFMLPRSEDPTSVLGRYMYGARPADLMSEEFDGLGNLAVIDSFRRTHWLPAFTPTIAPASGDIDRAKAESGYPCLLVKRQRGAGAASAGWQAQSTQCQLRSWHDALADELEIDLRNGAVMSRETDLMVGGALPLALTRCYRSWDDRIRAFGYNRGMGWDMYPVGSRNPYTYVDVILCDGRSVHFERISEGTNYADALFEHRQSASPFLGARFGWTGSGWDLALPSGAHLFFPESYHAKRAADGALAGLTTPAGASLVMERDRWRNLRRLSAPGGGRIELTVDALNRISQAKSSDGAWADYRYDLAGRLARVKTANYERQ